MDFAKVIWEKNTPKSDIFDDFYFSSDSGVQESTYNFIEHNFLEHKFKSLSSKQNFCICEAGFGAGLNFTLTFNLWQKVAPKDAQLEFVSFEKYPMDLENISKVLSSFKQLCNYHRFLELYKPQEGLNIISFENITLKLIIDDVNNIEQYTFTEVDCWFLDGFTPARNITMWNDILFKNMALRSNLKSSFATFTASSLVRKKLQKYGFEVKKDTGFGKKREMMYGSFNP
ncbi:tRNA (5-methylaminomethyl-2-thiouridine)(34)-methyltransferase MnmD [Francisella sp. LA112445]|uniref:tRNA (5-methylaminomethyl-2-thiouridine)(34)-methyltransferase MnmD n=1 Tax=Francisella sp. LA112445 TaxID=1395624 RepID=UPI001788E4E9|nr:tRNA (5-methylaminomethyl-2-thiouridine)(34)-methyltransferase MnmD [Francisella sp. LA112445]QIW10549.1 tRNA (5-methylaminomethyl-2-thiouridine)(34)-methyltransferase MnmD [Francisella sp. LA112445]